MELLPVHTPVGFDPQSLMTPLADALSGAGPAVAPHYAPDQAFSGALANDDVAAIISTSGSTGQPKQTMLSVDALAASAMGTAMALKAEGQWLLALPVHYVAGFQVLVRSLYAGTRPWAMDLSGSFTAEAFTAAATELTDRTRLTSLVPTQLHRLLTNPAPQTLRVLRRFDTILLGGAPASEKLLAEASRQDLHIVRTYGMSETCGGCVYDGVPLPGVKLSNDEGSLWIGGDVLAEGYLGQPELTTERFPFHSGRRWFRTDDIGEINNEVVTVTGRTNDVLTTGGVKVSAAAVVRVLEDDDDVQEAYVTGLPHEEWGTEVAAVVVGSAALHQLRDRVRSALGPQAVPKTMLAVDKLPLLPNGKTDRQQLRALLERCPDQHGPDQHGADSRA